jgi:uncharacterized protein YdaT
MTSSNSNKSTKLPSKNAVATLKLKASTGELRVHIVANQGKWAVKKEGAARASRIVKTKTEAVRIAREYVQKGSANAIISHSKDGSFIKLK